MPDTLLLLGGPTGSQDVPWDGALGLLQPKMGLDPSFRVLPLKGDQLWACLCAFHSQVLNSGSISHAQPLGQSPVPNAWPVPWGMCPVLWLSVRVGGGEGRWGWLRVAWWEVRSRLLSDWSVLAGVRSTQVFLIPNASASAALPRSHETVRWGWVLLGRMVVAEASCLIFLRRPRWSELPAHPLPAPPSGPALIPHPTAKPQSSSSEQLQLYSLWLTRKNKNQNSPSVQPRRERANGALEGSSGGSGGTKTCGRGHWKFLRRPAAPEHQGPRAWEGRRWGRGGSTRGPVQKLALDLWGDPRDEHSGVRDPRTGYRAWWLQKWGWGCATHGAKKIRK